MIEKTVLDYLSSELDPTPVYMERPINPPDEFILIEKTGSGILNTLRNATIVIQTHASSLYETALMNERVIDAMSVMEIVGITSVKLNSDYNFTDTTTNLYRYQAVFDIYYKE